MPLSDQHHELAGVPSVQSVAIPGQVILLVYSNHSVVILLVYSNHSVVILLVSSNHSMLILLAN